MRQDCDKGPWGHGHAPGVEAEKSTHTLPILPSLAFLGPTVWCVVGRITETRW